MTYLANHVERKNLPIQLVPKDEKPKNEELLVAKDPLAKSSFENESSSGKKLSELEKKYVELKESMHDAGVELKKKSFTQRLKDQTLVHLGMLAGAVEAVTPDFLENLISDKSKKLDRKPKLDLPIGEGIEEVVKSVGIQGMDAAIDYLEASPYEQGKMGGHVAALVAEICLTDGIKAYLGSRL